MRRELVETASWLPVWLAVMEDNAAMISVFPTVKLRCACEVYAGCTLSLPSLYLCRCEPRSSARGLIIPLMSHGFTKALQIRLSARECVCFPRMVRPSPISGDNKRQPWSLREISKIREKRGELGWLRVTSLAWKTLWGILDLWWVWDWMNDKPSVGNRWARQPQLRKPSHTEGEAIFSKQGG